ncbi:hypothetical protein CNB03945 [Cryptococcus deneoformans JEC21]|uniref:BRCT domain-containing protein n=1 Tax=Cryptococcus deneoformans (strain JEC21 / ATCC MYA-565) TaxID=214684 RepID=A0A0S2LI51_CRYD1|nr:hypothetical protein CNB03945 [Cryptococcus neoformans var. neoformans JEC21]ALO60410.1 hypothetical protein CNB03945 [Cryptococcus neoformans var. neoformans JEC21]
MTPSSSPGIEPISPPPTALSSSSRQNYNIPRRNPLPNPSTGKQLPKLYREQSKSGRLKDKKQQSRKEENLKKRKAEFFSNRREKKPRSEGIDGNVEEAESSEQEVEPRARVTERMLKTLGRQGNPITNSDMPSRTDHVVSCTTGHQRGEQRGQNVTWTYAQVRTDQLQKQAREKKTGIFKGCLFYFNGSTGPKLSNIQLRNLISENGGRFTTIQTSACTHVIANNGLSGGKTQKHLDMQGGRGSARQVKVVKIEWILDSVKKGVKLSEAGYGVVENPPTLFSTLGLKPKSFLSNS